MRIVRQERGAGSVTLYDLEPTPDRICEDVVRGLRASPKRLHPKYFYDDEGARLFERITQLEEYYPTRTELSILERNATAIATRIGRRVRLIEFGSGSGEKTWILLRHLEALNAYVPVDISRAQLVDFSLRVAETFPTLRITPVCADYTTDFPLPRELSGEEGRFVAFFPGSTIGNFEPREAEVFLARVRRLVGPEGAFLLGVDLRKDPALLEAAYDDAEGITARFNLNLLRRINRECGAGFSIPAFQHRAFFNDAESRIEMHLVSLADQTVSVGCDSTGGATTRIPFRSGEAITTEYSYKYDPDAFAALARRSGWSVIDSWTDPLRWFSVVLLG